MPDTTPQTLSSVMNSLHDSKAINLDTSLKDLLASQPVEPEGSRVDVFVGHNILFLTAEDARTTPTGTAVPPVATARTEDERSSSQVARVAQSGLINLDATLRTLVENPVASGRRSDFWALYVHSAYVLLHIPDQSGTYRTGAIDPQTATSIASDIHG